MAGHVDDHAEPVTLGLEYARDRIAWIDAARTASRGLRRCVEVEHAAHPFRFVVRKPDGQQRTLRDLLDLDVQVVQRRTNIDRIGLGARVAGDEPEQQDADDPGDNRDAGGPDVPWQTSRRLRSSPYVTVASASSLRRLVVIVASTSLPAPRKSTTRYANSNVARASDSVRADADCTRRGRHSPTGRMTSSMTCMTPFDASISARAMVTPLTETTPADSAAVSDAPPRVLIAPDLTSFSMTMPGTT